MNEPAEELARGDVVKILEGVEVMIQALKNMVDEKPPGYFGYADLFMIGHNVHRRCIEYLESDALSNPEISDKDVDKYNTTMRFAAVNTFSRAMLDRPAPTKGKANG